MHKLDVLWYQLKLAARQIKKGTAQLFKLALLARIFISLSWYDITAYCMDVYPRYLVTRYCKP